MASHQKEDDSSKKLIILLLIIVGIFLFGTVGFSMAKGISLKEGFTTTVAVVSFTHYEEEKGASKVISTLLVLFGVVFLWLALWEGFDIAIEHHVIKHLMGGKNMSHIKKLKGHCIICGGGRVGHHIADLLKKQGQKYVIVEKNEDLVKELQKKGHLVYDGDALDESSLQHAGIKDANVLLSVLPESEKNILVTLTAKELNPRIRVLTRSDKPEYVKKMKNAGAEMIVMPELACAEELVNKCSHLGGGNPHP